MKGRLTLICILFSLFLKAQIISGFVLNENGYPIPFASVFLLNTSEGTLSNSKGFYQILCDNENDSLLFNAAGYSQKAIALKDIQLNKIDVKLSIEIIEVSIVEIQSDVNFAKEIIKKVIKNKSQNAKAIQSYKAKAYVKVSLEEENPLEPEKKSKLNFIEHYSTVRFEYPNKLMVEKLGVKDLLKKEKEKKRKNYSIGKPDYRQITKEIIDPNIFFKNISDGNFNFYKNTMTVPVLGETPFISPVGNLALISYIYKYEGSFYEDNQLVHKILVLPRRKKDALFTGIIYINDQVFNIAALEFSLPSSALHHFKTFKIYQNYIKKDSVYVLNRQEFFYKVHRGKSVLHGSVYNKFTNYEVNITHPKKTFSNLVRVTVDSAYTRDTTYWKNVRSIPLKKEEKDFVDVADSIAAFEKSPEYLNRLDSINNRVTVLNVLINGIDHYNREKGVKWFIDPLLTQMRFAGVGGYRHAIGANVIKTYKNNNELDLYTKADYGFGNNDLLVNGKVKFTYLPKRFAQLRVAGGSKYQMLTYEQNIATIFSRSNFVRNDFLEVGHEHELINGLFLAVTAKYMQRTSIEGLNTAAWSDDLFGENNTPLDFEAYNEFNLRVDLSYTPFSKFALEPNKKVVIGSKWPKFHLTWQQGIPDILGAKINFQKLKFGVTQNIKWNVFGTANYALWAGKFMHTKNIEYPNMTFFRGTDRYLFSHPIRTFQLLGNTLPALDEYVEFHYIHHFNGMLIKKIPFLRKSRLESVVGGGLLYINDGNFQYSELYSGVEFPFKLWDTKFKLGAYYSVAYSNYSDLSNMVKFGLNIFNPFTNAWLY
tara:strand:+ start:535 stop:2994 length:2460 start_codon:yes stop_codon:yes gene_type:complete